MEVEVEVHMFTRVQHYISRQQPVPEVEVVGVNRVVMDNQPPVTGMVVQEPELAVEVLVGIQMVVRMVGAMSATRLVMEGPVECIMIMVGATGLEVLEAAEEEGIIVVVAAVAVDTRGETEVPGAKLTEVILIMVEPIKVIQQG